MQRKHKKITNSNHIRQIMSTTINMLLNDEMDSQTANSIATLCSTMLKVLRASNLEERIKRLEELEGSKQPSGSPVTSDIRNMIKELKN